ncbi:MAG: J domain-containing protein [Phycisphaeraceae bacterium]
MDRYKHVIAVIVGMLIGMAVPVFCAWFISRMHPEIRMGDHIFTIMIISLIGGGVGVAVNLPNSTATGESAYYSAMGSDTGRRRRSSSSTRKEPRSTPPPPPEEPATHGNGQANDEDRPYEELNAGQHIPHRATKASLGRREALHVLGLELTATNEDIRAAFRKLAKANHPDQFVHAGDDAVAEATQNFQRIHEAYKSLMG